MEVKVISGRTRKNIRIARKASQNSCLNTKHLQVDLAHPGVGFVFFSIVQLFSNTCTNMVAWGGFITLWGCVAASGTGSISSMTGRSKVGRNSIQTNNGSNQEVQKRRASQNGSWSWTYHEIHAGYPRVPSWMFLLWSRQSPWNSVHRPQKMARK